MFITNFRFYIKNNFDLPMRGMPKVEYIFLANEKVSDAWGAVF